MACAEPLANGIRQVFGARSDITERKMFGGLAFPCRGRMCCGVVGNDLMVRVAAEEYNALLRRAHVRPMDVTGKALRGFVDVSARGFRTTAALCARVSRGERVADGKASRAARSRPRRRTPSSAATAGSSAPGRPR